jgi:hypothetical protein
MLWLAGDSNFRKKSLPHGVEVGCLGIQIRNIIWPVSVRCQYVTLILNAALKVFWNFGLPFHSNVNNLGRTQFPGISSQWITHVRTSNLKSIVRLFNSSVPTILRQLLCLACEARGLPHRSFLICCWKREDHYIYSKYNTINIGVERAIARAVSRVYS